MECRFLKTDVVRGETMERDKEQRGLRAWGYRRGEKEGDGGMGAEGSRKGTAGGEWVRWVEGVKGAEERCRPWRG